MDKALLKSGKKNPVSGKVKKTGSYFCPGREAMGIIAVCMPKGKEFVAGRSCAKLKK